MHRYLNGLFLLLLIISLFASVLFPSSSALASPLLVPTLGPTKTDVIIGDDGDGKADPGETIEYTVTIPNAGTDATGVVFDDNPDSNTTFVGGSTAASPVAVNDTYPETVIGNVSINSALISYSVVSNDFLGVNPTATISGFDATSANGGQVTMTTSGAGMGQFTYNPPPGFEGIDTFTYVLTDNANASSAASNRTATVSIPVSGMVWFINNGAAACTTLAAGCGRLSNPFSTLAAFNSVNGQADIVASHIFNPAANDNIFVYESAIQYTGAVTLLSGQKLLGQDATASLGTITGLILPGGSPAFPAMNSANGTITNIGSTVTLNTNTTVRGLRINSTTSTALNDPAGTITGVNVSDISVSSTTATAVALSDVGGTFTFASISSNGGTSDGISITNQTGSFTVNGDGSNTSVGGNSTGGTIANKSGADGSTTSGIGVYMNNVQNITLRRMTINGTNQNFGIYGTNVAGLTVEYATVGGTNGTSTGADEGSIIFDGLFGTSTFTKVAVSGTIEDNFRIRNSSSTSTVTIDSSTFTNAPNDNIIIEPSSTATVTAYVTNNTFTGAGGDHFQTSTTNSATLNVVFTGNFYSGGFAGSLLQGITISGGNLGSSEHVNFNISNNGTAGNPLVGNVQGGAININQGQGGGTWQGQVSNNFIGNAAVTNSGSSQSSGIRVENHSTSGTLTAIISGNTIKQWNNGPAINTQAGDAGNATNTNVLNVTVTSNTSTNPGASSQHGFVANIGAGSGTNTAANVACVDVRTNTLDGNTTNGGAGVRVRQREVSTVKIPGYTGTQYDFSAVATFLQTQNPSSVGSATAASSSSGPGYQNTAGGALCAQPTVPTLGLAPNSSLFIAQQLTNGFKQTSYIVTNPSVKNLIGTGTHESIAKFAPALSGGIVSVNVGTLPSGKSVIIKFRVTVNGPSLPLGTFQISNQGTISGSNFSNVLTDDPDVGGASDPTTTPVDRPDTTVLSINRAGSSPTNANSVSWTVTFADAVLNLTSSNFTLVNSGLGGTPAITGVTPVSGPPSTTWTVTASTGTGDGSLSLNMANDTGLSHDVTTALPFTGQVYTIDKTAPTTASFARQTPAVSPTSADTLVFRVTFSEDVTGVASADFAVTGTTAMVTNIALVSTGVYDVTVGGGDLAGYNGAVGLNFSGSMSITDVAGNALANSEPSTDETYTLDNSAPTTISFTRQNPLTSPTSADTLIFRATFSEAVMGVGTADFTVTGTTATVTGIGSVGTGVYDVTVSGGDLTGLNGIVGLNFSGSLDITDLTGNTLANSEPATDETYTVDNSNPTVTINQAVGQADPTGTSPINFTVTFNEAVTGFATGDVDLSVSTAPGTLVGTVSGGPTTYNVAVSGMTGGGTVVASVPAGVATDGVNLNAASTSTDNTVTYDNSAPTVTINQAVGQADPTGSAPINFTVVFSEAVTGFATGDVELSASTAPGTLIGTVTGGPTTYNVAVSGMTGDGTIIATLPVGAATDGVNLTSASTSTDNSVLYDTTNPSVTINQAAGQSDPTNGGPINFTVVFSEAVTGFAAGDVDLSASTAPGTLVDTVTGGPTTYNVAVTGMTGSGTITASVASGVANDLASKPNTVSTSTDNTVTYDASAPTVTINQAAGQADPTSASPISFDVVFSEAVSGFGDSSSDVSLGGTAGAMTAIVTGGPLTYNVAVSGMTGSGTVIASIPAAAAQDSATNNTTASTSTDNTVTYNFDNTPPVVTTILRADSNPTSAVNVHFTVTFSESVTGVDPSDFSLTTTGVSSASVTGVTGAGNVYTATVNTGNNNGTIRLDVINNGSIRDAVLNPLAAGFTGGEAYTIINKSVIFADVPFSYWANSFIERLYNAGITTGCGTNPLIYCPDNKVTRAQMAVFLLKALHGSSYVPPVATGTVFNDIPASYWAAAWIEQFYAEGITSGCGNGNFCPEKVSTTRAEMAVFLLRGKYGSNHIPPAPSGIFNDVPVGYWAAAWIEQLYAEGITSGCGNGNYCPEGSLTRAEMAVFLVKTFNLP